MAAETLHRTPTDARLYSRLNKVNDTPEVAPDWHEDFFAMREKIAASFTNQPDDITLFKTFSKLGKVYEDYYCPPIENGFPPRDYAFVVHPRDPIENDIQRQFPALSPKFMTQDTMIEIFESLPPMVLGEFRGLKNFDGETSDGWVISAPITAGGLYGNRSLTALDTAKGKVLDTAKFARVNLGVKLIGLGETLGSLSKFGTKIEDQVEGLKVTTGHAFTVHLVGETLKKGAEALDVDISQATLAVVGGAGAIGSSAYRLLAEEVKRVILIDDKSKETEMARIAAEMDTETIIATDKRAMLDADLIVVATSTPYPFITKELVRPGTIVVDDSQPVNMTAEAAKEANVLLLHPIAQLPEGVERTFDFSLPEGSDFSCAAEVLTLAGTGELSQRTIGRLTDINKVKGMSLLAAQIGVTAAPLQSFGEFISEDYLENVRANLR